MEQDTFSLAQKVGETLIVQNKGTMHLAIVFISIAEKQIKVNLVPEPFNGESVFSQLKKLIEDNELKEYVIVYVRDISMINKKTKKSEKHKVMIRQLYSKEGQPKFALVFFRNNRGFLGINSKVEFYSEKDLSEIELDGERSIADVNIGYNLNVYKSL